MEKMFLLNLIFLVIFSINVINASDYYVAINGNDSNPGTLSQPWRTIQHAVDSVLPGDTIYVRGGVYEGARIEHSGTSTEYITLRSYPAEAVIINSPSSSNVHNSIIEVETWSGDSRVSYWVIEGFEIMGATSYGIDLRGTYYIIVRNNKVHYNNVTGIFTAFSYFTTIQNNESYDNGEHGIYISNSSDYVVISNNVIYHNYSCGIHMNGDESMGGDGIITGVLVEKNIIYENGLGGGSAINMDGVMDSTVKNNLLYNNHASGISLYQIDGAVCSSGNWIMNNTVIVPSDGRWALNIPGLTCINNNVYNNIFYNFHSWRGSISIGTALLEGFKSDYNIVMDRFSIDDGTTSITLNQWRNYGYDIHSLISTPSELFVDYLNDDYHLKSASPAIDIGYQLTDVIKDLDDYIRPKGTGYDIGCYEYGLVFNDVPGRYWASYWIEILYKSGITQGCSISPLSYCPEDFVYRDQMAVFIGKGVHGSSYEPPAPAGVFGDVPVSYWAAGWVEQIYNDGIAFGCSSSPPLYCPSMFVRRDQMAVFLVKAIHGTSFTPQPAVGIFEDVPINYWAAPYIEQLFKDGITDGCSIEPLRYCPSSTLTRAQMAKFLVLAFITGVPRPFPITKNGIYIFNDQLTSLGGLTTQQIQFAVSHYVGTQKMIRNDADILRSFNPSFIILHYRLGQALGYRVPDASCNPTGGYLQIINGTWVQEWPGDANVQEQWFYHYSGSRVYSCTSGHYLTEIDNISWRHWYSEQIINQLVNNDNDGVFADSYSPANYLGPYNPPLPSYDLDLEQAWANREYSFTDYIRYRFNQRYYWLPNYGSLITTRDPSNYTNTDGGMVEGFGYEVALNYGVTDWKLQMNRILALTKLNKKIIMQSYISESNITERMFNLASYLLVKGLYSYLNMEIGMEPEWFPEYSINLGAYLGSQLNNIDELYDTSWQVYIRDYDNGIVLVNPSNSVRNINLGETYYLATPQGGGFIPIDGQIPSSWKVNYTAVSTIMLPAVSAAILIH